MKTKLNIKH